MIEKNISVALETQHPNIWSVELRKGKRRLIIDDDYDLIAVYDGDDYEFEEHIVNLESRFDEIWEFVKSMIVDIEVSGGER